MLCHYYHDGSHLNVMPLLPLYLLLCYAVFNIMSLEFLAIQCIYAIITSINLFSTKFALTCQDQIPGGGGGGVRAATCKLDKMLH